VPPPVVRVAAAGDAALLAAFTCSRGEWYEDEVEEFIRDHALDYASWRAPLDHQLLLFLSGDELVAVGAHEQALLKGGLTGTHLAVAAIALPHQGAKLDFGGRLSDFVLDALLGDASAAAARGALTRDPVAHALVAADNDRSLALLRRRGFDDEQVDAVDPRYLHLYARIV
jgi:hypothetical protein